MKQCATCYQWKNEEEFNWRYKTFGIRYSTCRECHKSFRKNWYLGHKEKHLVQVKDRKREAWRVAREYVWNYLLTHPCVECGEKDPIVLEFHHRHEKEKPISVMTAGGYPVEKIQTEINKCEVLCANCHRRKTMKQREWFRGLK